MMYVRVSNEDGTYTEKKVYSEEDMKLFVDVCKELIDAIDIAPNEWLMTQEVGDAIIKIDKLLKFWEEQK